MRSLVVTAPSKINLYLGVGPLRPDGYHGVQTVMHTLRLADTVRLFPADALTVSCDVDLDIPERSNLAYRAAEKFSRAFDVDVLLDVRISKAIPAGAGLGGGSADAAAVLAGLAYWSGMPIEEPRLQAVARALGADVPFLTLGGAALMGDRGDTLVRRLRPMEADVVVVQPMRPVPTAEAYRAFDAAPVPAGESRHVADALRTGDLDALGLALSNNLTGAATALVPEVAEVLGWLGGQAGVIGSAMSGSGSAVFALCCGEADADRIAKSAEGRGWWSAATRTSLSGPVVSEGDEVEC